MRMAFNWYENQSDVESRNFGSLALIVPLLERMNVGNIINRHLPADPQAEFDYGTTLSLLIAARLHGPTGLSNVAQWAEDSGADVLWNMPTEKINDDRLGRALDAFFLQRHSILASLALHVSQQFDVPLNEVHYDPTHLLFTGEYDNAQPRGETIDRSGESENVRSDAKLAAAHITKGRATEDAPKGSQMVHAGLMTYVDELGPLPFFGHTVDGNQNGRKAIDEQLGLVRKHLQPNELMMFSDRGTYSIGHLSRMTEQGFHAVCSAPWGEFRELFDEHFNELHWKEASYLSIEQQRRRQQNSELPREHYELAEVRDRFLNEVGKQIPYRAIFVYSTADCKVVQKQRQKQIDQIREGLDKTQRNVARRGPHSDETSVTKRVNRLFGSKDAAKYFSWKMVKLNKQESKKLRSTERGSRDPDHRFEFTFDQAAVSADAEYDGYSVIVTTVPSRQLSADEVFGKFKQQIYSEQVNRTWKGPLKVRPIFLHTPERVEALVFLLIVVLMAYYLLQRTYRAAIPADASESDHRTTTNTLFEAFRSYTLLVHRTRMGQAIQPTKLTSKQREVLQRVGFESPAQVLSKRLPRSPT